jgi:hypothetical protein
MLKRLIFILTAFLFFSAASAKPILAQTEFATSYDIIYFVSDNGVTTAKYTITLTNQLSNIYATEFSLSIGSTKVSRIKAYDSSGALETKVVQGNKTTNITIPFKQRVVGKNKSQVFRLEFDSRDFANRLGSIWEISIPKLSKTADLKQYRLQLALPQSFGRPAFITPAPRSSYQKKGYTYYSFDSNDLLQKGISATFGQTQYFDFSLQYHLENPRLLPAKTEIALPPDSQLQKVIYQTITPPPQEINIDQDGNWLAVYILEPKQSLSVTATGSAEIYLSPRQDYPLTQLSNRQLYLREQKYWETNHPKLQKLAETINTPEKIYRYVVDNLIYDYGRLSEATTRFGAANALDNPDSAICMEFTDLFIGLARAAGIPARAVNGYAYTTNSILKPLSLKKDVLHSWPEYYDKDQQRWIPVDPTWGNTTGGIDYFNHLDLNHFAFVFQGINSDYPVPAGAYKTNNQQGKSINVRFGSPLPVQPQTQIELNLPTQTMAGLPLSGSITIKNTGNVALYNQLISLNSDHFNLSPHQWNIAALPPFAATTIKFELPATAWNSRFTDTISITSELASVSQTLTVTPVYRFFFFQPLTFQILGGLLSLSLFWLAQRLVLKYSQ